MSKYKEERSLEQIQQENIRTKEAEARKRGERVYGYVAGDMIYTTRDKALASRYNAQHRYFGMNKFQRAVAVLTGQRRKFYKLWEKTQKSDLTKEERMQTANELDKMFRR